MVVWRLSKVGFWFVEQLISDYLSHHLSQGETKGVSQDNAALLFVCRSAFTTQSVTMQNRFHKKMFQIVCPSNGWGVLGGDYKKDRAQVSTSTLSYLHLDGNHGSLPLQLLPQKVFIFFLQMIPLWIRIYCSSHYSNTFRNAHCTLCSLCSYQLNKLIHSLEFMSRYTILHIFVPVCSVERKTWFTRKLPFSNFKLAVYLVYFNWFCVFQKCAGK